MDDASIFLAKAEASLAGAESELLQGRFDNCANRSYYACFQAAIAALITAGIRPPSRDGRWGHDFVQARLAGDLVNRRKLYSGGQREAMERLYVVRQLADYKSVHVSEVQAQRVIRKARSFVGEVQAR
jgi:uncharacterized protein (UPF0332 family)